MFAQPHRPQGIIPALAVEVTHSMAALRDNLDASASCTLPEVPLHWRYSWDAENRLVAVAPAVPAAGDKKVVFTYDYMSRRVQKRVFAWDATLNGGTGDWEANPEVYQRFVYDQWNVVLVLDGPNRTITHKYTWGLDLSGLAGQGAAGFSPRGPSDGATAGIHAAGGIGGLLAVEAPQAVGDPLRHWYFYDGNGNVGQLLAYDATGPTVNATPPPSTSTTPTANSSTGRTPSPTPSASPPSGSTPPPASATGDTATTRHGSGGG
jgi:hypothetical protein